MTSQQIKEVASHLEGWGNTIVAVEYYTPEVFLVAMAQPISEAELTALDILRV